MNAPTPPRSEDTGLRCAQVREMLGPYHDGELAAGQSALVARHLAGCADCERALVEIRRVSSSVRALLPPLPAPDLLRSRVRAALRDARDEPVPSPVPLAPASARGAWWLRQVAAGIVIAVSSSALTLAVVRRQQPESGTMEHGVVERHVHALMTGHLTDVLSSDQHTVKPWFNGKVDFSPEVHLLADAGFPLAGGRVDSLGTRAVAALVYGRRQHVIDVYTWPAVPPQAAPVAPQPMASERGYHTIHWRRDGMEFWAVSDLNPAELRQFVDGFLRGDVP